MIMVVLTRNHIYKFKPAIFYDYVLWKYPILVICVYVVVFFSLTSSSMFLADLISIVKSACAAFLYLVMMSMSSAYDKICVDFVMIGPLC